MQFQRIYYKIMLKLNGNINQKEINISKRVLSNLKLRLYQMKRNIKVKENR